MLTYKYATSITELLFAYGILATLQNNYPAFSSWYWDKIVPSVVLGNDKVILAYNKNDLVGVSVIKINGEAKLRALRILNKYKNKGYGLHLIDKSLLDLNNDKPLLSVSEDMLHDFSRIFINRYNFNIVYIHKGIYMPGKLEYQFNGNKDSLLQKTVLF